METNPRSVIKRPDVLKKLNNESLAAIERGLLGDIPIRLRPQRPTTLDISDKQIEKTKNTGLLSSCLPIVEITPSPLLANPQEESLSPLKKTFSFRDKIARINPFGKDKSEKQKLKEERMDDLDSHVLRSSSEPVDLTKYQNNSDSKSKRFWFFKKEQAERREPQSPTALVKEPKWFKKQKEPPIYVRSKSFEFLPRALEEYEEMSQKKNTLKSNRHSFMFGSHETMGDAWSSNNSLEFIIQKPAEDDGFQNLPSSISTVNTSTGSASTSGPIDIFKGKSMQDLLEEFEKAVELFQDENYLSDSEVYKGKRRLPIIIENRKSSSFSALPSPKIVKVNTPRPEGATETFKRELASVLSAQNAVESAKISGRTARRGSVTDWFVIDESSTPSRSRTDSDRFRRPTKKPVNRIRRVSSTKYVSTNGTS